MQYDDVSPPAPGLTGKSLWYNDGQFRWCNSTKGAFILSAAELKSSSDRKLIIPMAKCRNMHEDGARIVLEELATLRNTTGIPHQAIIVVKDVDDGFALEKWINSQSADTFGFQGIVQLCAGMLASREETKSNDAVPAAGNGIDASESNPQKKQRTAGQDRINIEIKNKLRDGDLDVVICCRMLAEGYNNELLSVLGLFR